MKPVTLRVALDDMSEEQLIALAEALASPRERHSTEGWPCDHCLLINGTIKDCRIVLTSGRIVEAMLHQDCVDGYIDKLEDG